MDQTEMLKEDVQGRINQRKKLKLWALIFLVAVVFGLTVLNTLLLYCSETVIKRLPWLTPRFCMEGYRAESGLGGIRIAQDASDVNVGITDIRAGDVFLFKKVTEQVAVPIKVEDLATLLFEGVECGLDEFLTIENGQVICKGASDDQNLTLTGTVLTIENGNSVSFANWDTDVTDDVTKFTDLLDTPSDYGTAGYLLRTDGSGSITYVSPDTLSFWVRTGTALSPRYIGDDVVLRTGETLTLQDFTIDGGIVYSSGSGLLQEASFVRIEEEKVYEGSPFRVDVPSSTYYTYQADSLWVDGSIRGYSVYIYDGSYPYLVDYNAIRRNVLFTNSGYFAYNALGARAYGVARSGVTNTANITAVYGAAGVPSNINGEAHQGTLSMVTGVRGEVAIWGDSHTGTIDAGFALLGLVRASSGTINNFYGLMLDKIPGAGTINNLYGVYVASSEMINYFAGQVGIGTASPDIGTSLHISGPGLLVSGSSGVRVENVATGISINSTGVGISIDTGITGGGGIMITSDVATPANFGLTIFDAIYGIMVYTAQYNFLAGRLKVGDVRTGPVATLHVSQFDPLQPLLLLQASSAPSHNLIRLEDGSGIARFRVDQFYDMYLTNSGGADTIALTDEGDIQVRYGKVGIGTSTPSERLHIVDGLIVSQGTFAGSDVMSVSPGEGTWFIWYPRKAAVRMGALSLAGAGYWDDVNIGDYSAVIGGEDNMVTSPYSAIVGGTLGTVDGFNSGIFAGNSATVSGDNSAIIAGNDNIVDTSISDSVIVGGTFNSIGDGFVTASGSVILGGDTNSILSNYSVIAGGMNNTVDGDNSVILGGSDNTVSGVDSVAGGVGMNIDSLATGTFVWGHDSLLSGTIISDSYVFLIGPYGNTYRVGINVASPTYALTLPNNIDQTIGKGIANAWDVYSDARIKTDQQPLDYGLEEILKLQPKRYIHHSSTFKDGRLILTDEGKEEIGLIAQEVYEVIPEVVNRPDDENKELWTLDYQRLVPVLIKAIQELAQKIDQGGSLTGTSSELWLLQDETLTTAYKLNITQITSQSVNATTLNASVVKTVMLEVAGGKLSVDSNGNLVASSINVNGDLTVFGTLKVDTLQVGNVTFTDKLIGEVTLSAGSTSVKVEITGLDQNDKVFVTNRSEQVLAYSVKVEEGQFTIIVAEAPSVDVQFDYMIVKVE